MPFPVLTEWLFNNLAALVPVVKVHSYQRGVKFRFGKDIRELRHGIYFYLPYIESIEIIDIQQQVHNLLTQSMTTMDNMPVSFSCNTTFRITNARKCFTEVHDFHHSMESYVMMIVADEVSSLDFTTLVTDRKEVEERVLKRVKDRAKKWGASVDDFAFTDLVHARQYRRFGDN